ncbi:bromodomain-containing protein 8-like [Neodiprion virginianus]|uniref:bromodomain-containing protein 8-like n=1 Tax=Neodiprion virginianus TaxID=2961670 RepID=UPI001EE70014|nr:bromodomain-containing protein 8-like [Neodiprion virginianus]
MASAQDRMKVKRVPYDTWSTREQLCLAASVLYSGENVQNWKAVSESLEPFAEKEALRPPDWFSQKSCAVQYSHLLETADTPKRKKRESGETQAESIVNRLTQERIAELKQILAFQRDEYQQLKAEVNLLKCGPLSDDKLQKMWQVIEQEEREQEQKVRAYAAWLTKRQQKQESMITPLPPVQRKAVDSVMENHDASVSESSNNDEDEKKRGGRSPLLTSLLKSTSPTTQVQTPPTPTKASSPTIASLLVSSPKVPSSQLDRGLVQNVSSQLQQLVSTAIANAPPERPSAGAPTLSMLLELPANPQRGSLPNLQPSSTVTTQLSMPPEIHSSLPTNAPSTSEGVLQVINPPPPVSVSQNIPVTESMVQIIDHIDEVIGKDIMADVIDKDEINEIIGDIEELIKEEITSSPRTNETPPTATVVEPLTVQTVQETVSKRPEPRPKPRPEPRNVDEPVSLSDSPESELAIEDIDSSTSNIAEIIGTVAVESTESKIMVTCQSPKVEEKAKSEAGDADEENMGNESLAEELRNSPYEGDDTTEEVELSPKSEGKESESNENTPTDTKGSEDRNMEKSATPEVTEDAIKEETDLIEAEKDTTSDSTSDEKEPVQESEIKQEPQIDQLEMDLAEITGDPQDKSAEAAPASVSSETSNDGASAEEAEKSQDISLILEDDESSQGSQNKDKTPPQEQVSDMVDTFESCPEESTVSTEEEPDVVVKVTENVPIVMDESTTESKDNVSEEMEKEEDKKESFKDSIDVIVHQVNDKEAEVGGVSGTDPNPPAIPEAVEVVKEEAADVPEPTKTEESTLKEEAEKTVIEKTMEAEEQNKIKVEIDAESVTEKNEEVARDNEMPEDKPEIKETLEPEPDVKKEPVTGIADDGDLDEEESSLSKLSGGRTMKTYSKRPVVTIDSEPENEGSGEGADYRAWKKAVMLVFNRLVTHKYASVFLRPITEDQAPGYHSVIFRPMDLSTIKKNIDNGTIRSTMHFQRDVMLMFQNAIMYNKQDTFVYKMAVSMQEECLQHMQILVQVTGEGPFRRETRTAASSSSDFGDSSAKPQRKRSHITPSPHDSDSARTKKRRKSEND